MSKKDKISKKIKELISKDKIEEALTLLKSSIEDKSLFDDVIIQSAKYQELRKLVRKDIISFEQASISRGKIRHNLIDLANEIEGTNKIESRQRNLGIFLSVISLIGILIISLIYFGIESKNIFEPSIDIVPPPSNEFVIKVPFLESPDYSNVEIIEDRRSTNLRKIKPNVPKEKLNERWSPATWARKIRLKKINKEQEIRIMSATSGPAMDIRCLTHINYRIEMAEEPESHGKIMKFYHAIIDVSRHEVGQEFEIIIEATNWNGFDSPEDWWVSMVTFVPTSEISQTILFPENRPIKNFKLLSSPRGIGQEMLYTGNEKPWINEKQNLFNWEISNPKENYDYRVSWVWKK